jgi:hypothetical protein
MVLVSESPGEDHGALGVVTLEDVIEELIGEEIVDETDVFVDVSRHLKRMNPAAAFAHRHSFRRISSRQTSHGEDGLPTVPSTGGRLSRRGSFHTNPPVAPTMKPLNKANEPNPTTSTKVTIKPGSEAGRAQHNATILSSEERLLGKRQARDNQTYGSIPQNGIPVHEPINDAPDEHRSRGSGTIIEERVNLSSDGEGGKVVISPVPVGSDIEENDTSPLLSGRR